MADKWHPDLINEEYVPPEKYQEILLDSIFCPCPKGNSIETFRLYEVLESGAIPVVHMDDGYTAKHFPPMYFKSPMVFVNSWTEAVDSMLEMMKDPASLDARQAQLREWYSSMMSGVANKLEGLLETR